MDNGKLIYIGSVTRALRAKDILKYYGIVSSVEREQNNGERRQGCGYSVMIVSGSFEQAKKILAENGFDIGR